MKAMQEAQLPMECMIIPSFMKTGAGVQAVLRLCLRNVNGCNVRIPDGKEL